MILDEINPGVIFDRIKALYRLPSDAAMARFLEINPQEVSRFRKSTLIPYKHILNACAPIDWAFVLLGEKGETKAITIDSALETLIKAGYRVTIEKS